MARNRAAEAVEATTVEATTETPAVEATEAPVEATETEATEAPVEATETEAKPEVVIDLTGFEAAVATALETKDETTGDIAEADLANVVLEYRKLDGQKAKNKARKFTNDGMKEAMEASDIPTARALMKLGENLTAGPVAKAAGGAAATREPVNPTEAYIERIAGLRLALNLVQANVPEGIDEDWVEKSKAKVAEGDAAAEAYKAAVEADAEELPETDAWVVAAVKLADGKSAKIGGRTRAASGQGFDGPRRSIKTHVTEAFAEVESGTFLSIAEIRKFKSAEYGDDAPSAGAISAALFPKSGKPAGIEGVEASEQGNKKGAVKA